MDRGELEKRYRLRLNDARMAGEKADIAGRPYSPIASSVGHVVTGMGPRSGIVRTSIGESYISVTTSSQGQRNAPRHIRRREKSRKPLLKR